MAFALIQILITENGCACPGEDAWAKDRFSEDRFRQGQIKTYINGVWEAMNDYGVDVIGYTYWSLMDNFEWAVRSGRQWIETHHSSDRPIG